MTVIDKATLKHDVEQFLYREAALADAHDYEGWLGLWADECLYFIPANEDETDPEIHVALIHEKRMQLEDRIRRLSGNFAHTQQPKSRLSRIISNVWTEKGEGKQVIAHSVFNLTAFRRHKFDIFAGRTTHVLNPKGGDTFEIVRKTVFLINNDGYMSNMTFLI